MQLRTHKIISMMTSAEFVDIAKRPSWKIMFFVTNLAELWEMGNQTSMKKLRTIRRVFVL